MLLHDQLDIVSLSADGGSVVLSMVETRPWDEKGANVLDLQKKVKAYLNYVETGQLWTAYPQSKGKKVEFRLHARYSLTPLAEEFIARAKQAWLDPLGIAWSTVPLSSNEKKG